MVALVSVETVLLVILLVLVAGLLRSHAELLRRLGPGGEAAPSEPPLAEPPRRIRTGAETRAAPLSGATPDGDAITLSFEGASSPPTLLAFLSSGCSTCAGFWETLGQPRLPGVQTLIVTRGGDRERPARLRDLAPEGVPVVMSSQAWSDYGVPGAPYFVLVHGGVRGEGVATSWSALSSLVRDAIEDERESGAGLTDTERSGPARSQRIDETFAAAGIGPSDPSLYPGRPPL